MVKLSVIIPHKNRNAILLWNLDRLLNYQTLDREFYEIIVVDDGSDVLPNVPDDVQLVHNSPDLPGPGNARNAGAELATGDALLFLGSDCIPDRNLLFRHAYEHAHLKYGSDPSVVCLQGLTLFHPQIMDTEFMHFIDRAGLQANWQPLKNDDGSWKREATGYLLTTNWSIQREAFLNSGGFHPWLKQAAWDDVELGIRLNKLGFKTIFDPGAVNFHYHRYDLNSFARRQRMEGRNRMWLALAHNDMATNLLAPDGIRAAMHVDLNEKLHVANQIGSISQRDMPNTGDLKYQTWGEALQLASFAGIVESLEDHQPFGKIYQHLTKNEDVVYATGAWQGVVEDNPGWTSHCAEWLITNSPDNWAIWAFAGEVARHFGDNELAQMRFNKSIEVEPNDWAIKGAGNVN